MSMMTLRWQFAMLAIFAQAMTASAQEAKPAATKPADAKPAVKASSPNGAKPPSAVINYLDPKDVMIQGGPLMWPILLCSIITLTFGLERLIALRRGRIIPRSFVRRFFRNLDNLELNRAAAIEQCRANESPTANIFLAAVRHWGKPALEIEQAYSEVGQREIARMRRNLRILQGSGNIAMLLGLLGTVVGMIQAFNQVAVSQGLGRAEVLAGGIAQALLTTAAGLVVAIPSLFLYNYFAGRVERLVVDMDELAGQIVDVICAESRPDPTAAVAKKPVPKQTTATGRTLATETPATKN